MSTVRRGRGPFFAALPHELQDDERADSATIAVYAALRRYADWDTGKGGRASHKTLAEKAGCSVTTLKDRIERLVEMGWVEYWSGKDGGRPNDYTVHASAPSPADTGSRLPTTPGSQPAATGSAPAADPVDAPRPPVIDDQEPGPTSLTDGGEKPIRTTWLTTPIEIWKPLGELDPRQAAKWLAPVRDAVGDPEMHGRLRAYVAAHQGSDARYASVKRFHDTHGAYGRGSPQDRSRPTQRADKDWAAGLEPTP